MSADLSSRTIALCVTGSIAAYKAVEVARLCKKAGARVIPVMTHSATRFVGPTTLAGICGEAVANDMWDPNYPGEMHVTIARDADLVAVVPSTADLLSRLASGRADDLVTAIALCTNAPVVVAPAMHPRMWAHPATQRNVATLAADRRVTILGPVDGEVASGERGLGRMMEPEAIVRQIALSFVKRDLAGTHLVVTAGPTVEDFDPVRFVGNRSTGKMGFAIAERAAARGAEVTLIAGPVHLSTPHAVTRVDVRSALDMRDALWAALGDKLEEADALIMTAAVADYRPVERAEKKLKKQGDEIVLNLVRNPDLLAEVGAARKGKGPVLIGFAVETEDAKGIAAYAQKKLREKRVDLIVANHANDSFGKDNNRVTFVSEAALESLPVMAKGAIAEALLDRVRGLIG